MFSAWRIPTMIQISALPAFTDNYIWLLQDHRTQRCAVVDPGDAAPVQAWLDAHPGWVLSDILITHHHHDHVGGVERLKAASGAKVYGPASENIPGRDVALKDNDTVSVLGWDFDVYAVPGHTLSTLPTTTTACCFVVTRCSPPVADACSRARRNRCTTRSAASPHYLRIRWCIAPMNTP
jgi:hypothetical protein